MIDRRSARIVFATAIVSVGVPAALAGWVRARTEGLADTLSTTAGLPVSIGRVDADLTGAIRLSDIAFGSLVTADAVEASVAMSSLVGGNLRADEIRVAAPRLSIRVDADGDSDLARLARRFAAKGRVRETDEGRRIRRIVVSRGTLTAHVEGIGELIADGVELVPDPGGVRVITGQTRIRGAIDPALGGTGPLAIDIAFARSAAEVAMPQMTFRRVLAVGGSGVIRPRNGTGDSMTLGDLAAGRLDANGALEIRAKVEDGSARRPIAIDVAPSALAITLRGERVPLRTFATIAPPSLQLARARGSGEVVVRRTPRDGGMSVVAKLDVDGLVVDHSTLAPSPIAVDGKLAGELSITRDTIAIPRAALQIGSIQLAANGWARRSMPASALVELSLARAPCASLVDSLPADIRGPLDGIVLRGDFGMTARLSIDLAAPEGEGALLSTTFDGGCDVLAEPPAADVTTLAKRPADDKPWVRLKSLPSHVGDAFISAEDGRFWDHRGFDLEQIARSIEIDLRERRLARGGSTISQQLVKNAFLTQRRSLDRKLQEAVLTWRLEAHLEKRQILERYLNIIELGPRIFGIREAARFWFDRSPDDLSVRQSAFLAALTSQPTTMSRRVRKAGGLDADSAERVAIVLRAMRRDGAISKDEYDDAKHASLHFADSALLPER